MKTAVANVFPVSAALILPCWKRKELRRRVVINSTTILNKGKFGFNKQSGTTDLTQTYSEEQDISKTFILEARTKQ